MKIKIKDLKKLITSALATKYDKEDIDLMLPVIMFGELSGRKSHGIIRVVTGKYSILALKPTGKPQLIKKTEISVLINSQGNSGMLVATSASLEVIKIARKHGIAIVGTMGSQNSSGSLSFYAEKIANEGFIGIIMSRATADIAPFGSMEPLLGTNPIAFGFPTSTKPFIFDMSTSSITFGSVMRAKTLNDELPGTVAIDSEGNPTRNPDEAIKGAFLPFDNSYKGSGLAMVIEILAGILPGADFADKNIGDGWGNLFIAINPKLFISKTNFEKRTRILIDAVKNAKTKGGTKVRVPGENTIKQRDEALERSWVEVDDQLVEGIRKYLETGEIQ
jgi:LDH2 family malate/lactate/ureidoglycolate dehydrogenase